MSNELNESITILTWIAGIATVPLMAWCIAITWILRDISKATKHLLDMHLHPDEHGFGTEKTNRMQEENQREQVQLHHEMKQALTENTRAVKQQTKYLKWSHRQETGEELPPVMDDDAG